MKKGVFLSVALIFLLALASAIAQTDTSVGKNKGAALLARYGHLSCRADLMAAQAETLNKNSGAAVDTSKITNDLAALKGYSDSGDKENFNKYVAETLLPDAKNTRDSLQKARGGLLTNKNLSKESRLAMRSEWKQALDVFSKCNMDALKGIVAEVKAAVDKELEKQTKAIADMEAKGLDTSEVKAVQADTIKLQKMAEDAVASTSEQEFKDEIESVRESHLHVWARFEIARINAYAVKLEPLATQAGLESQVTEIKNLLAADASFVQPRHKYKEGEFTSVWQNIKDAGQKLKDLAAQLKSAQKTKAGGAQ